MPHPMLISQEMADRFQDGPVLAKECKVVVADGVSIYLKQLLV